MITDETTIEGYRVELEFESEGENVADTKATQCFVSKGKYSASLEALLWSGCLTDIDSELKVPARVISAIESWAQVNGY